MKGIDPKGPSKPSTHGGSGEPQVDALDDMVSYVSSGMASDLQSYLDPPIENYRIIYSSKIKSPNASRNNSG